MLRLRHSMRLGVLYAVIGDRMNAARYNIVKTYSGKGVNLGGYDKHAPFGGTGFRGAYAPESQDKADPVCSIVAIRADSGEQIWRKEDIHGYTGCSLAIRGRHAVYQTAGGLFCLNPGTGKEIWSVEKTIQGGDGTEANTETAPRPTRWSFPILRSMPRRADRSMPICSTTAPRSGRRR